jgi:hypothetical protein
VKHWCSAIDVAPGLNEKLTAAGLEAAQLADVKELDPSELLLIYSPPDQLLEQWRTREDTPVQSADLRQIYQQQFAYTELGARCAADWRLNDLDTTSLLRLIQRQQPRLELSTPYPEASPIASLVSLQLFKESPDVLENYLNLELHAELFGLQPDSDYIQRLQTRSLTDLLLTDWWQVNAERECSREQADSNLLRMQQVQNDFDRILQEQSGVRSLLQDQNKLSRDLLTQLAKQQLES